MVVEAGNFRRNSSRILYRGEPWLVTEFGMVKPGKGGAYIKTKLRNLKTGVMLEVTFRSGERLEEPDLTAVSMQYLYRDQHIHFMDQESFEQISFSPDQLGSAINYLKEGEMYRVQYFEGQPIAVEPPIFLVLEVVETVPGVKGNTAQGGSKPAKLESGLVIQVPLFVSEGDKIKIDTREDKYIERV